MKTLRLTTADALVRWLVAQRTVIDGRELPLFAGVFAIFGHGNVVGLGNALDRLRRRSPPGAVRASRGWPSPRSPSRRRSGGGSSMVATSSIGPGAHEHGHRGRRRHANRLPLLLLSGDAFASRIPDPVLQQVEHFDDPTTTVNDAFRAVTRYWDRITRPPRLAQSLPQMLATLLDPADCGPAFLGLPQDVQAEAYDFSARLFEPVVHELPRPRPDVRELDKAAPALRSLAVAAHARRRRRALLARRGAAPRFVEAHEMPVVETVGGKSSLRWDHPLLAGPIGVTGCGCANALAAESDVVLAVGTRLQDFTTGSWTVFRNEELGSSASTPHDSTPSSTSRCPGRGRAGGLARACRRLAGLAGPRRMGARARNRGRRLSRVRRRERTRTDDGPADVRPGRGCRQPARARPRLRAHRRGRLAGRAQRQLAWRRVSRRSTASTGTRAWATRSRARGAPRWPARRRRGVLVRRRRLVPHAQLRALQLGAHRPEGRRDRLRQRRLRGDRPAPGGQGGRPFNNMLDTVGRGAREGRLGGARARAGLRGRSGRVDRRARGGGRPRAKFRPDDRDRDRDAPDRWTRAGRSGRSASRRSPTDRRCRRPRAVARRQAPSSASGGEHLRRADRSRSACSARAGSARCTPSSSPTASRVPCSATVYDLDQALAEADGAQAWRHGGEECRRAAPRGGRRGDLHEHRHARRA